MPTYGRNKFSSDGWLTLSSWFEFDNGSLSLAGHSVIKVLYELIESLNRSNLELMQSSNSTRKDFFKSAFKFIMETHENKFLFFLVYALSYM